ncbi:MAG: hypothetical protein NC388_06230 [Clostridium sp.]|nr:hypothetical protein [Clostridium sp.]
MKKKNYTKPVTDILTVTPEGMLAASIGVDNTVGDGLEGNSLDENTGPKIWAP